MARIIVLDSGPLGDACRRRGSPEVEKLTGWWVQARANGAILAIPEMADYEVRRGLLWDGSTGGIRRLDQLRNDLGHYIPITTAAMRKAANSGPTHGDGESGPPMTRRSTPMSSWPRRRCSSPASPTRWSWRPATRGISPDMSTPSTGRTLSRDGARRSN